MIKCPNCGKINYDSNKFCSECGTDLSEAVMYCPKCYEKYYQCEKFCTECGTKLIPMKEHLLNLERIKREKGELENKRREEKLKRKQGVKICPSCGKKILKNAIRCKYCKEIIN